MPAKKSGGLRAGEKRRAQQEATIGENADWCAEMRAAFAAIAKSDSTPEGDSRYARACLRACVEWAPQNPTIPPHQALEQAGKFARHLAETTEPEKRIETLTNDLREIGDEVRAMKEKRGARITGPTPAPAAPGDFTVQ